MPSSSLTEFLEEISPFLVLTLEDGELVLHDYTNPADTFDSSAKSIVIKRISAEQLAAVDARLPAVLEFLSEEVDEVIKCFGHGVMSRLRLGLLLNTTIGLWQNPQTLTTASNDKMHYTRLSAVKSVDYIDDQLTVLMMFSVYTVVGAYANGALVEYATNTRIQDCHVSPQWLDTAYPGWKERYDIASTLGYSASELANYILQESVTTEKVDTAGVQFNQL